MQNNISEPSRGISYKFLKTDRFKTTVISMGFYLPIDGGAAANSLALSLMRSGTAALPDPYSFQRKLASLYGATVSSWTAKQGDAAEYRINISVNADRYSLENENTVNQAGELFCDMVFGRFLDGTEYPADAVTREKRLLSERIAGKMNDKRIFARSRCEEETCKDEPYGMSPDGTCAEVRALQTTDVTAALERLIKTAFLSVIVIGEKEPDGFKERIARLLSKAERKYSPLPHNITAAARDSVNTVEDKMPVEQGKLVIALRSADGGNDRETTAMRVMADIFGGGPYSKLFCNVREKMSLCYYCSARPVRSKGLIFVESGVQNDNMDAAQKAICEQFEDMKKGAFSEKDLKCSKLALLDAIRSAESDQQSLLGWYSARALDVCAMSPKEACAEIEKITADDVISAAKGFAVDTVYRLTPAAEKEE